MNFSVTLRVQGGLLIFLGAMLITPIPFSLWYGDGQAWCFLVSAAIAAAVGTVMYRKTKTDAELTHREGFAIVTFGWLVFSLFGCLPYLFTGVIPASQPVDAFFEAMSGFTTTGSTVLTDLDAVPKSVLFWRSMTQWLGGMGIIVLGIAILPKLAIGGMELLGAEAPGPTAEKLTPRIAQTAKALWGIYVLLTAAQAGILLLLGLSPLDAVAHAFTTMATAGFSTLNASVGGFDSVAVDLVVTFFMVVAGANFALHFQLFRGRPRKLVSDPEFRIYIGVLAAATVLIATNLVAQGGRNLLDALQLAVFQATSIVTTTGFTTDNFAAWPNFAMVLLFLLMFMGGCAGSTAGSVKVVRNVIVFKRLGTDLRRMIRPHAVLPVRLGDRVIPDDIVTAVTTFFILFLTLFTAGGLSLVLLGIDPVTSFSASASCLTNVGPGFGLVSPGNTYEPLPDTAKLILIGQMIIGRLEIYTILILLFLRRRG